MTELQVYLTQLSFASPELGSTSPTGPISEPPIVLKTRIFQDGWSVMTKAGLECVLEGVPELDVVLEQDERLL